MSDVIDLAFGFDENYAPHTASVLASVVRYAPGQQFRVIMLHAGVGRSLQERVEAVAPQNEYLWCEIQDEDLPQLGDGPLTHINRATLFRMGLEKYAPADCTRVLYLDSDISVLRDMRPLWRTDMQGQRLAAVIDAYLDPIAFAAKWQLDGAGDYFNAGILLIDLGKVRAEKLFSRTVALLVEHGAEFPYNDQDALNIVFWRRWTALDAAWNIQRHSVIAPGEVPRAGGLGHEAPGIVHFTGPEKPWLATTWHPWAWAYWENLERTPFLREVAQKQGVDFFKRLRLRLRYLRRGPRALLNTR